MKAIILAGGKAKRLKPITNDLPKCLLHIKGETIIDRQIRHLNNLGINDIVIVTGFKSELLTQHLSLSQPHLSIKYVNNDKFETTGPAYGLWLAKDYFNSDIIYLNGDLVCDEKTIKSVLDHPADSVTALSKTKYDTEQVKISTLENEVLFLGKNISQENTNGEFIGVTKLSQDFLSKLSITLNNYVKNNELNKFAADSINDTIKQQNAKLNFIDISHLRSIEVDTIEDYQRATKMWSNRRMSQFRTLIKIVLGWLVYSISFLSIRSKSKVIFYGWHKNHQRDIFADNAKYLFLHLANNPHQGLRPIWISQNNHLPEILKSYGYESYSLKKPSGIWHCLTSKYFVIDALMKKTLWQYSGNAKVIQLWHGKGMKKTGYQGSYSLKNYRPWLFPELFIKYFKAISSSEATRQLMSETFNMPAEKIEITGLPRNDVVLGNVPGSEIDEDKQCKKIVKDFKKLGTNKLIAYMPTFRPSGYSPLDEIDLNQLNSWLVNKNWHLIITLHPKYSNHSPQLNSGWENIKICQSGFDIYPLLSDIDILITDYSSIYIDFLLTDKPIIFFVPDKEKYQIENGLQDNFDQLTPGPHPVNFTELIQTLDQPDTFQSSRKSIKKLMHHYSDNLSSERVTKKVFH